MTASRSKKEQPEAPSFISGLGTQCPAGRECVRAASLAVWVGICSWGQSQSTSERAMQIASHPLV